MEKIKEKNKESLIYLAKGVLVRLGLINSEFDTLKMRDSLKSWFIQLEKELKELIK